MPRRARIVCSGIAHHIYATGKKQPPGGFSSSASDYELYFESSYQRSIVKKRRVAITAYCLMPNHVHLIAVPDTESSLARALGRTHSEYALAFNRA